MIYKRSESPDMQHVLGSGSGSGSGSHTESDELDCLSSSSSSPKRRRTDSAARPSTAPPQKRAASPVSTTTTTRLAAPLAPADEARRVSSRRRFKQYAGMAELIKSIPAFIPVDHMHNLERLTRKAQDGDMTTQDWAAMDQYRAYCKDKTSQMQMLAARDGPTDNPPIQRPAATTVTAPRRRSEAAANPPAQASHLKPRMSAPAAPAVPPRAAPGPAPPLEKTSSAGNRVSDTLPSPRLTGSTSPRRAPPAPKSSSNANAATKAVESRAASSSSVASCRAVPTIATFLNSLPVPLARLEEPFARLGLSRPADLLALASETDAGRNARKILLDAVEKEDDGAMTRWERIVLEEELKSGWARWSGNDGQVDRGRKP